MIATTTTEAAREQPLTAGLSRRWRLGVWFGIVLGVGMLMFTYHYLAVLAEGESWNVHKPLIHELTAAFGAGLLFFAVRAFVHRMPLDEGRARQHLPVYLVFLLLYSAVHTSLNWGSRTLLYLVAGFGVYDYGRMPTRYFMEFPMDVIGFTIMVVVLHAWRQVDRARRRELRASRIERDLAQAHLRNLQLQLQPHFLFNALNTVSSVMYRDIEKADSMIEHLADLLRASLRTARADRVPLSEELSVLEDYLAIMRARFEERLCVEVHVDAAARCALVPPLLLQPLVENGIRHGGGEAHGRVRIVLRAGRESEFLHLVVEDDGPGLAPGIDPLQHGLGLGATAERLRLLYEGSHRLEVGRSAQGGFRVSLCLPYSEAQRAAP